MAEEVRMLKNYNNRGNIMKKGEVYPVDKQLFKTLLKGKQGIRNGDPIPVPKKPKATKPPKADKPKAEK